MLGSENAFPFILLIERASPPDSPDAGGQLLYLDSVTHQIKRVNSGGGVTSVETVGRTTTIPFLIDGAGSPITTGVKGFIRIPFACTLTGWTILSVDAAALSGSIVIDVWKDVFGNYPPTNADSITNGHEPTLTTATHAEDTDITDWSSRAVSAGDVLGFNVDSITTVTRILLQLTATIP